MSEAWVAPLLLIKAVVKRELLCPYPIFSNRKIFIVVVDVESSYKRTGVQTAIVRGTHM